MAVQRAADMCGIPESTLRDRVKGKVKSLMTKSGPGPVLGMEEEGRLVEYIQQMCQYGYSYSRTDIINIASDFAIILGKREPSDGLTHQWYYKCLERWPDMTINRAASIKKQLVKATSVDCSSKYFLHLQELMNKYNLNNKPDSIFIIDEVMIEVNRRLPYVNSWRHYSKFEKYNKRTGPQPTMTIIASGNASGARLPAFFIFPGKTVSSEPIEECSPGTGATCSDDGMTNCNVFQLYLENHYLKFIERKDESEAILVLYDGHRTHMSPDLVEMYKSQNVHLFPIPPSGSQALVELDKGIFGNIERIFERECAIFVETEMGVDRDLHGNICSVASKAYNESVSAETLKNAFKRFGLWPFKPQIVNKRVDMKSSPPEPPSLKAADRMLSSTTSAIKRSMRKANKRPLKKVFLGHMDDLEAQLAAARKKKKMLPSKRLNYSGRKQSEQYLLRKKERERSSRKGSIKMRFLRDMETKRGRGRPRKVKQDEGLSDSEYETESDYEIDEMLSSEEEDQADNRRESAQRTVELSVQREHFESALRNELLSTHGLYFEGSRNERGSGRVKSENKENKNTTVSESENIEEGVVQEEQVIEEAVLDQNEVAAHIVALDGTSSTFQNSDGTVTKIVFVNPAGETVSDVNYQGKEANIVYTTEEDTEVASEEVASTSERMETVTGVETGPTVTIENLEVTDVEHCCVCGKEYPDNMKDGYVAEFCTWGKCDFQDCDHWTHLKYCCDVKVLRRHDIFYCPCHNQV